MPDNTGSQQFSAQNILAAAQGQGATEVHYAVGNPPIMRVAGSFVPVTGFAPLTIDEAKGMLASLLNESEQEYLQSQHEIVGAYTFPDGLRCRYHIFFQKGAPSFSLHILSKDIPTIQSLGLPDTIGRLAELPHGLVAVTGPYGSGRSSTIAALINSINQNKSVRILTLESPIEYIIENAKSLVEQREIGRDALSYEAALKEILNEDVDVISVSEVASAGIASLVMELASSRLVFIMLDDSTAIKAIEHLMSLFPAAEEAVIRSTLSDVLGGVVAQRILPRPNGSRLMVAEVLLGTSSIKTIIRDGKLIQLTNILQTSRAEGMISLDQAMVEAVRAGTITPDEAERQAVDPHYLGALLKRGG